MASVEGRVPLAYHASYAATKHGIIGLDAALRQELRLNGLDRIGVVTILPWAVDTPFWGNAATYVGRQPRAPLMDDARHVSDAVVWAAANAPRASSQSGRRRARRCSDRRSRRADHADRGGRDPPRADGGAAGAEHLRQPLRAEPRALPRRGRVQPVRSG
jgi:NAD(P)-dependent dehydrogenase (short-subunit alcohol dehydrogenase family)